jgi:hypothetical protein
MPILAARPAPRRSVRYERLYLPGHTWATAWAFLRESGGRGLEQLCFLGGRTVQDGAGLGAQVTSCVLPLTVATPCHVTLTSVTQTALILDALDDRREIGIASVHTHPGAEGSDGLPAHSTVDDEGVALVPDDGVFSLVVARFARGSPWDLAGQVAVYERLAGAWRRLPREEVCSRVVLQHHEVRIVPSAGGRAA